MHTLTDSQKLAAYIPDSPEYWNLWFAINSKVSAHVRNLIIEERQDISLFNWENSTKAHDINSVYCVSVPVQSTIEGELCAGNLLLCFDTEGELIDYYVGDWKKCQ